MQATVSNCALTPTNRPTADPRPPRPACAFCGSVSGLVERSRHVGGHGYQATVECRDRMACWRRQIEAAPESRERARWLRRWAELDREMRRKGQ